MILRHHVYRSNSALRRHVALILLQLYLYRRVPRIDLATALTTSVHHRTRITCRKPRNWTLRSTGLLYKTVDQSDWQLRTRYIHGHETAQTAMVHPRKLSIESERAVAVMEDWQDDWGVEYHYHHLMAAPSASRINSDLPTSFLNTSENDYFPSTVHEVTDAAASTIVAILHQNQTYPDPNRIQNTVHGDTVMGRRSVRHPNHDAGRIGIELDWSIQDADDKYTLRNDYRAVRLASLVLAGKLSQSQTYESYSKKRNSEHLDLKHSSTSDEAQQHRPIAIYFNTVQQALEASRQLWELKRLDLLQQKRNIVKTATNKINVTTPFSIYDSVHIRCLCQGDTIPKELMQRSNELESLHAFSEKTTRNRRWRQLTTGKVDPTAGLILVVQPTDYNDEYRPPGPSIGVVESLQRLVATAAVEQLPVVLVSPRFLKAQSSFSSGWDQSGYHQRSSLYGGLEPPKGPTPWILRDFTPPAFCYVANALSLNDSVTITKGRDTDYYCNYSHLSLWQSVLHKGHSWNLFAAFRQSAASTRLEYHCIATTRNVAGRPTRQLMRLLWSEYCRRQQELNEFNHNFS
jgi:hypothetical protein